MDTAISIAITCLWAMWQASYRQYDLYSGLVTELGNLNNDVRLRKATACGFAGNQREMTDKHNLKAEYQCIVLGADLSVIAMKFL